MPLRLDHYEVSKNGGSYENVGNVTSLLKTGLSVGESDTWRLRAVDSAGGVSLIPAIATSTTLNYFAWDGALIAAPGNSLRRGFPDGPPYDWGTVLASLMAADGVVGHEVVNLGHDSATTSDLLSYSTTELYPLFDGTRRCFCPFEELGNQIFDYGDVADAVSLFQTWYANIVAAGLEPFVIIPSDRGTVSSANTVFGDTEAQFITKMATARATVIAWCVANGIRYIDLSVVPGLDDHTNATYFVDRVHRTHLGYATEGQAIWDAMKAIPYTDTLVPVVTSITIENANTNKLIVTLQKHIASTLPANTVWTISGGRTGTATAISGNVITITASSNFTLDEVVTLGYTQPGSNKVQDLSGNLLATFAAHAVTNNLTAPVVDIHPDLSLSGTTFFDIAESPTGTFTGGVAGTWNHHALCDEKIAAATAGSVQVEPVSGVIAFGLMDTDDYGNYTVIDYGAFINAGYWWVLPGIFDSGYDYVAGDYIKPKVTAGGTISLVRVRSGSEVTIYTFGGTHAADKFVKFVIQSTGHSFRNAKGIGVVAK